MFKHPDINEGDLGIGPQFIRDMSKDYKDEAKQILENVDKWESETDEVQGIPGLGKKLIDAIHYISQEEEVKFESSVASEMTSFLEGHPEGKIICVAHTKKKGSGLFFYGNVTTRIPEEYRDRISIWSWVDVRNTVIENPENNEYYIIDDSSNSNQQLDAMVAEIDQGPFEEIKQAYTTDKNFNMDKQVKLKIRLMRITNESRKKIERKYVDESSSSPYCVIDFDGNAECNKLMPTVEDVLRENDILTSSLKDPDLLLESHAGRRPTTLGIFFHKIQDNMPQSMLWGGYSHLIKQVPLIAKDIYEKIGSMYSHYGNVLMGAKES